jgi:hypothetical protein
MTTMSAQGGIIDVIVAIRIRAVAHGGDHRGVRNSVGHLPQCGARPGVRWAS